MAALRNNEESGPPCKRKRPLYELARKKKLHHLIPAALSENDVNARNYYSKWTALHLALRSGCSLETLIILKEAGADFGARDIKEKDVLFFALTGSCSDEVISELLDYLWESIFEKLDRFGFEKTFRFAAEKKRLYVFIPFMVKHDRINYRDSYDWTLLRLALTYNCLRSVETLLEVINPAALNDTDEMGNTYLHLACVNGCSSEIICALLNAGLNPVAKNKKGDNALHLLMSLRRSDFKSYHLKRILKEVLRHHPEIVKDRNSDGELPLDKVSDHFSSNVIVTIYKWVLLQVDDNFQCNYMSSNSHLHWILNELKRLRAFMVTDTLSLGDLVKACYVSPKFINKLRVEKKFVKVLQFVNVNQCKFVNKLLQCKWDLSVYEEEVRQIVRMVKACSSLYGKTLPFPLLKNGSYVNVSQKVLDYLDIDDLEKLAIAVNNA